jgi:hypothetical protein
MRRYAVVYEKAATNWAAYVPDLSGCITTGATLEETKRNIREAQCARSVSRCRHQPRMSISWSSKQRRSNVVRNAE